MIVFSISLLNPKQITAVNFFQIFFCTLKNKSELLFINIQNFYLLWNLSKETEFMQTIINLKLPTFLTQKSLCTQIFIIEHKSNCHFFNLVNSHISLNDSFIEIKFILFCSIKRIMSHVLQKISVSEIWNQGTHKKLNPKNPTRKTHKKPSVKNPA